MSGEIEESTEKIKGMGETLKGVTSKFAEFSGVLEGFGRELGAFEDISKAALFAKDSIAALDTSVESLIKMSENFGLLEAPVGVLNELNSGMQSLVTAGTALDAPTESFRMYTDGVARLGRSFGMTFEASKDLRDEISGMMASTENRDFYFSSESVLRAASNLMDVGVAAKYLDDEVSTLNNTLNASDALLFQTAVTGESLGEVSRGLKDDIYDYGMTLEDSMLQFAGFSKTSEETGLNMETVKRALKGAAGSFKDLGMSSDFAKPFLEGFVTTLDKVGVGIENATKLAGTMSRTVTNLASDYGKAHFIFQQGGLDFGGGDGVLGAGIGFRSKLLQAEKSGEQGEMALDVAKAMKSAIENLTGGDIITVTEAADTPSLQGMFAAQESLLKDFGISGTAEIDRTLELLQDLDNVSGTDKGELKDRLDLLNSDTKDAQEQTLNESQKTNASLSRMITQNTIANSSFINMMTSLKSIAIGVGGGTREQLNDLDQAFREASAGVYDKVETTTPDMLIKELSDKSQDVAQGGSMFGGGMNNDMAEKLYKRLGDKIKIIMDMTPETKEKFKAVDLILGDGGPGDQE